MIDLFISPSGDDTASGTSLQEAFATPHRAVLAARSYAGKKPITLYFRGGTYPLKQSLVLSVPDSGSESAPIVYRPYEQESVRLTGEGIPLKIAPFTDASAAHPLAPDTEMAGRANGGPLLWLRGVGHVAIQNLTFECGQGDGVVIDAGENVRLLGCRIRQIANTGIAIAGGRRHRIQSCDVDHTGGAAIQIGGGDRMRLDRCDHVVDNCDVSHFGQREGGGKPGIVVSGVGVTLSHNRLHDGPNGAISLSGNDHLIASNRLHHVCLESGDTGAISMGGDWTERGICIEHNFFYDLGRSGTDATAVWMDDCASGSVIFGNVFARCSRAVFIGGGRNHRVENNVFVACEPALEIDGRGLDMGAELHGLVYGVMKARFLAMNPLDGIYKTRYPELREVAMYYQAEDGTPPEGNLVLRNMCSERTWYRIHSHASPKMVALQNNLIGEDPHFLDPERDNYTLDGASPAYEIGIKPIRFEQMGLYADSFRQNPGA